MKSTIVVLSISIFISTVIAEQSPIVSTKTGGQVVGSIEKSFSSQNYFAFRRIPFAEPPTGELRFKVSSV
jgi:carboxylesterase type B